MSKKLDLLLKQLPNIISEKMIESIKPVEDKIKEQVERKYNDILQPYLDSDEEYISYYFEKEVFKSNPFSMQNHMLYNSHPLTLLHREVFFLKEENNLLTEKSINKYNEFLEKQKILTVLNERFKLLNTVDKKLKGLDIKSVKCIYATLGNQGVEGRFEITLKDNTVKTLITQGIYAGGYNIQKLHLRYLSEVK